MSRRRRARMVAAVLGITADAALRVGLVVVLAMVALALLFARFLVGNLAKVCAAGLLVAGAIYIWSQRSELEDCANRLREEVPAGTAGSATCRVSGIAFTVDLQH